MTDRYAGDARPGELVAEAEEHRRADLERLDVDAATPAPHDDGDPGQLEAYRRMLDDEQVGAVLGDWDAAEAHARAVERRRAMQKRAVAREMKRDD